MVQPADRRLITEASLEVALDAEAALARNADNLTSGTVDDARIPSGIARDSEVTAAVAAEAALARNGDNITSGTVADARIAATIARDSEVTAAVAAEAALARNGDNITSGTVAEARIDSTIARDTEVATAISGVISKSLVDAKGDLIVASAADTPARLGVGTDGQALVADSLEPTGVKWSTVSGTGISPSIVDAKGDLIAATTADTVARKPVGSNGSRLVADSSESTGLRWSTQLFLEGTVAPEGSVTAVVGTRYVNNTTGLHYVKVTGSGNTGWQQLLSSSGWQSYTPTLTATTTNPTLGTGGSIVGEYCEIGDTVHWTVTIIFGSSGTAVGSGIYEVLLPVARHSNHRFLGHVHYPGTVEPIDGKTSYVGNVYPGSTTSKARMTFINEAQVLEISSTNTIAAANSKTILFGTYRKA